MDFFKILIIFLLSLQLYAANHQSKKKVRFYGDNSPQTKVTPDNSAYRVILKNGTSIDLEDAIAHQNSLNIIGFYDLPYLIKHNPPLFTNYFLTASEEIMHSQSSEEEKIESLNNLYQLLMDHGLIRHLPYRKTNNYKYFQIINEIALYKAIDIIRRHYFSEIESNNNIAKEKSHLIINEIMDLTSSNTIIDIENHLTQKNNNIIKNLLRQLEAFIFEEFKKPIFIKLHDSVSKIFSEYDLQFMVKNNQSLKLPIYYASMIYHLGGFVIRHSNKYQKIEEKCYNNIQLCLPNEYTKNIIKQLTESSTIRNSILKNESNIFLKSFVDLTRF